MESLSIEQIMDKYGYIEHEELGKLPILSDKMTEEELEIAKDYYRKLNKVFPHFKIDNIDDL